MWKSRGPAARPCALEAPFSAESLLLPAHGWTLGTPRLLLRPPTTADLPHVQRYAVQEQFYRYMEMDVPTPQSVETYLATVIAAWADPHGRERVFAVEPRQAGRIAGLVRIAIDTGTGEQGSVGYSLDPDFQGHGYATEALGEVIRFGFEKLGIRRFRATVDTRNERSWRALERAGFRREGRMPGHRSIRGVRADSYLYAVLDDERG